MTFSTRLSAWKFRVMNPKQCRVNNVILDDGPDKLESDGTNSTSGGASTNTESQNQNSSGYNSNDNHASAENLNPLSRSFSISKLKRPVSAH